MSTSSNAPRIQPFGHPMLIKHVPMYTRLRCSSCSFYCVTKARIGCHTDELIPDEFTPRSKIPPSCNRLFEFVLRAVYVFWGSCNCSGRALATSEEIHYVCAVIKARFHIIICVNRD